MCATCHVYVDDGFAGRLPEMSSDEDEMLDATASERRPTSRLSCQIELSYELDGLVVRLPDSQILVRDEQRGADRAAEVAERGEAHDRRAVVEEEVRHASPRAIRST